MLIIIKINKIFLNILKFYFQHLWAVIYFYSGYIPISNVQEHTILHNISLWIEFLKQFISLWCERQIHIEICNSIVFIPLSVRNYVYLLCQENHPVCVFELWASGTRKHTWHWQSTTVHTTCTSFSYYPKYANMSSHSVFVI